MKQVLWLIALFLIIPFTVKAITADDFTREEKDYIIEKSKLMGVERDSEIEERYFTYDPRETAPSTSDYRYYSTRNPYVRRYPMPNCTTYAYGRFWEVYNEEPKYPLTQAYDATTIYWHAKNDDGSNYKDHVGQIPGLGSIAVWSTIKNDSPTAGASNGHVAIVEGFNANKDIITSNSEWKGTNFYTATYLKSNGYNFVGSDGRTYYLQGFVYQPKFHFLIE